jgi:hypothetical protein
MVKNRSNIKAKKTPKAQVVRKAPLAINTKTKNVLPRISQNPRSTRVSHREILRDSVQVLSGYQITDTIAVQPAIQSYSHGSPLGTWLPKIAAEYDNYVFDSLKVHFTTSASSLQKGTILMAYDPNPDGLPPSSFSDLRNMAHAVTGPARENLTLDLTGAVKGRKLLTRTRAVTAYPLYDCGRIFLGSTLGDDATVGYFEVEYSISLMNPQTTPSTEIINFSNVPPAVQVSDEGYGTGPTMNFGTTNAARNAYAFTHYLLRLPKTGDSSLYTMNSSSATTSGSGQVTFMGVTYSWASGVPLASFTVPFRGRYRVTALINGDFQDYATFGASIVRVSNGVIVGATDYTVTSTGQGVTLPVIPASFRGFTIPSIGGGDTGVMIDQTFSVLNSSDSYAFAVGVRNNTGISENTTAQMIPYPTGNSSAGANVFRLEYLGAIPDI